MKITQPMLAAKDPVEASLKFPLAVSDKRDGIRCVIGDLEKYGPCGLSRNFTPIQNKFTAQLVGEIFPPDFDGELQVVAEPGKEAAFRQTSSGIQSRDGEPNFLYSVFDWGYDLTMPYEKRVALIKSWFKNKACEKALKHGTYLDITIVHNLKELLAAEEKALAAGFEGLIMRALDGPYKCGRATLREGWMTKWVRKIRFECSIIGFVESMKNNNYKLKNEFGRAKRSSHKENKEGKNTLGSLKLRALGDKDYKIAAGLEFEVGTGFDADLRQEIWNNRDKYLGRICTIESRPYGGYDLPRFPAFIGWRDESDMDTKPRNGGGAGK